MQTQTMSKAPTTQPTTLPPLQNLPSWSRSSFERRKQPKSIIRDQLQPIKSLEESEREIAMDLDVNGLSSLANGARIVSAPSRGTELDPHQRLIHMEKSLDFLQSQHATVLENLHLEIERLKAENKALTFKLVMSGSGVNLEVGTSPTPQEHAHDENSRVFALDTLGNNVTTNQTGAEPNIVETQVAPKPKKKELRKESGHVKNKSQPSTPTQQIHKSRQPLEKNSGNSGPPASGKKTGSGTSSGKSRSLIKSKSRPQVFNDKPGPPPNTANSPQTSRSHKTTQPSLRQSVSGGHSMLMVTIRKDNSIEVHIPTETAPRSPTLSECKTIIKQQQETNTKQSHELTKLKSDLKEAVYSHKWTPDSYFLAKPYIKGNHGPSASGEPTTQMSRPLPRLPIREQPSGRLTGRVRIAPENVSLPVLRPNINSTVADRRRRQQAILRGRTGRRDLY